MRRMEGEQLHPIKDERGINRFDPDEVEQVAEAITRAPARATESAAPERSAWEADPLGDDLEFEDDHQLARQLEEERTLRAQYEAEARRLRAEHEAYEDRLRRERETEKRRRRAEEAAEVAVARLQAETCELVELLTPREVGRLSDEDFADLLDLLENQVG